MENIMDKCSGVINELIEKYKDNEYILNRLQNHVANYLPNTLENELKIRERKIERHNYLSGQQQIFVQVFLSKNRYYHLITAGGTYYEYNGVNYKIIKEDEILHKLLTTITSEKTLMVWKQKTKNLIMNEIRTNRGLFQSIPESETIQNVLNTLTPSLFKNKNATKYFLTILGDNILKKGTKITVVTSIYMKNLIELVNNVGYVSIGMKNVCGDWASIYHPTYHTYENIRLIQANQNISLDIWREILNKIGLDMMCVAAHYSKRYESSDKFIEMITDEDLRKYVFQFKNNSPQNVVDNFCEENVIKTDNDSDVFSWNEILFLWEQYYKCNNFPKSISNGEEFIQFFKNKYNYDGEKKTFTGIAPKNIPIQKNFIQFWKETININLNKDDENAFVNELEIDEICALFKIWYKKTCKKTNFNNHITEDNIINIINYFCDNVEILENKYIIGVDCILWNKTGDIKNSFNYIKEQIKNDNKQDIISFDEAYNYYSKYCKLNSLKFIVNKRFFETFISYELSDYVVYDKFIVTNW